MVVKSKAHVRTRDEEMKWAQEAACFFHSASIHTPYHSLRSSVLTCVSWNYNNLRRNKEEKTDLFFIFILQPQPVLYAVPGLKERLPLSPFRQDPHKDSIQIYTDKKNCIGHKL